MDGNLSARQAKRETSISVSELQGVSDQIKRLAISIDGAPQIAQTQQQQFSATINSQNNFNKMADFSLNKPVPGKKSENIIVGAKENFSDKYEILSEIGRGGFSMVYKCRNLEDNRIYAVKTIDLRPLRLREKFNPKRVRREVEIMSRLRHPNIIQFIDVFETDDQLLMVMEYCPGDELFDVILSRKCLSEEEARVIFAQVARAIYYLHCLNILHRDIKPENILILHERDSMGRPIAKLLDFGLSKHAGSSIAKTFVGTPCYLAPEVEQTSKGTGSYSLPADCWSVGAVLYVMLVARFPEFEMDPFGKIVLKLSPELWGGVSEAAKDLLRSLMNTNPAARATIRSALMHPWLGAYAATKQELDATFASCYDTGQHLQEEEEEFSRTVNDRQLTAAGRVTGQNAMVLTTTSTGAGGPVDSLPLAPLLHLQRTIASCFEEVHESYKDYPEVATQVRKGAVLCREQLTRSTRMLKQVEQTANEVLNVFPDLELAIEEGEPSLAAGFFDMVKGWVVELKQLVNSTQHINKQTMDQIQEIIEKSTLGLQQRMRSEHSLRLMTHRLMQVSQQRGPGQSNFLRLKDALMPEDIKVSGESISADEVLELFANLFGLSAPASSSPLISPRYSVNTVHTASTTATPHEGGPPPQTPPLPQTAADLSPRPPRTGSVGSIDIDESIRMVDEYVPEEMSDDDSEVSIVASPRPFEDNWCSVEVNEVPLREETRLPSTPSSSSPDRQNSNGTTSSVSGDVKRDSSIESIDLAADRVKRSDRTEGSGTNRDLQVFIPNRGLNNANNGVPNLSPRRGAAKLAEALHNLQKVDQILEHLSIFWSNTEIVLDALTKKGKHVEQMIGFAGKPRLLARFKERLDEYRRFWEEVSTMASNYISGIGGTTYRQEYSMYASRNAAHPSSVVEQSGLYGFLDRDDVFAANSRPPPAFRSNNSEGSMGSNSGVGSAAATPASASSDRRGSLGASVNVL